MERKSTCQLLASASVVVSLLASAPAQADNPFPLDENSTGPAVNGTLPESYLSLSGVVISETTLDQVISQFGANQPYRASGAEEAPSFLCYTSASDDTAVIFQAGPLGGWKIVTAIWVGKAAAVDPSQCKTSDQLDQDSALLGNLSLATKSSDLVKQLGEPTEQSTTSGPIGSKARHVLMVSLTTCCPVLSSSPALTG